MKRSYIWITGFVLYGLFFSWYTSFEEPMTEKEISVVLERAKSLGRSEQNLATLENFMRTDTGNDFIM